MVYPIFEDILRDLRSFSAAGGSSNDDASVLAQLLEDLFAELEDWKFNALIAHPTQRLVVLNALHLSFAEISDGLTRKMSKRKRRKWEGRAGDRGGRERRE